MLAGGPEQWCPVRVRVLLQITAVAEVAVFEKQTERRCCCEACGAGRHSKGGYPVAFFTLYGDVRLASQRLHRFLCQSADGLAAVLPLCTLIQDHKAKLRSTSYGAVTVSGGRIRASSH